MPPSVGEPVFSVDSWKTLKCFEDSLRARVYNLIEDHVRRTRNPRVTSDIINQCIERAVKELAAQGYEAEEHQTVCQ